MWGKYSRVNVLPLNFIYTPEKCQMWENFGSLVSMEVSTLLFKLDISKAFDSVR
jgi:hypothetical protein